MNFDFTQLTAYGGSANLSFDNGRFESSNRNVQPNPQYNINLDLSYDPPFSPVWDPVVVAARDAVRRLERPSPQ